MVRVRAVENGQFINTLTRADFELLEDGVPQKIDIVYLVKQNHLERSEPPQAFFPPLGRNFILLVQMVDYDPKVAEAVHYLFDQVLLPGDTLTLQTISRSYYLPAEVLAGAPRKNLAEEYIGHIRKDTLDGNSIYKDLIKDLRKIVRSIDKTASPDLEEGESEQTQFSLELELPKYREALQKLDALRAVNARQVFGFAQRLKSISGQKNVIFVYQREFRPEISPMTLQTISSNYQDQPQVLADLQDLFQNYSRSEVPDLERLRQVFADAEVQFNFVFTNYRPKDVQGLVMREYSGDFFRTFSDVAAATGGVSDNSQNLFAGFQKAAEAGQDFYLLAYTPAVRPQGEAFRTIVVRTKTKECHVFHRLGYFAR
jgi:VWFA-related protein